MPLFGKEQLQSKYFSSKTLAQESNIPKNQTPKPGNLVWDGFQWQKIIQLLGIKTLVFFFVSPYDGIIFLKILWCQTVFCCCWIPSKYPNTMCKYIYIKVVTYHQLIYRYYPHQLPTSKLHPPKKRISPTPKKSCSQIFPNKLPTFFLNPKNTNHSEMRVLVNGRDTEVPLSHRVLERPRGGEVAQVASLLGGGFFSPPSLE